LLRLAAAAAAVAVLLFVLLSKPTADALSIGCTSRYCNNDNSAGGRPTSSLARQQQPLRQPRNSPFALLLPLFGARRQFSSSSSSSPHGAWGIVVGVGGSRRCKTRRSLCAVDDDPDEEDEEEEEDDDDILDSLLEQAASSSSKKSPSADSDDDDEASSASAGEDEDDVPETWTEQDILAELGEDDGIVVEDDDDEDDDAEDVTASAADDDDEDDDEIDLDDIELDLDDDDEDDDEEEGIVEEYVGGGGIDDDDVGVLVEDAVLISGDEEEEEEEEWDDEEDGPSADALETEDDPSDPNYTAQKEIVRQAIRDSQRRAEDEAFDPLEYVAREMTEQQARALEQTAFLKAVEERARGLELTPSDVESGGVSAANLEGAVAGVPDLMDDDPYPRHEDGEEDLLEPAIGLTDDDMEALDDAYKEINRIVDEEPWDKVAMKDQADDSAVWDSLPSETLEEMEAALGELGGSAYNVTRWLLYDLDFNVTNLILAAVKHNRNAPVLLQHWYPQLVTYERYRHARDRDFDFTWDDVENADISELERYYAGFGYDEIPNKAPAETGIISFEDLDEEEIKMAAFENWMTQVYNPEWDRKDFDDDDMRDEDNVFSDFYDAPQHPDLPTIEDAEEDIDDWQQEIEEAADDNEIDLEKDPEVTAYRDMMGEKFEYEEVEDEEFEREFRGHLIVACTGRDEDLDVAEKITSRFEKEFGKQVMVETRVMALAREEDNVFEIWLESYEIDLLHSKKRATSNAQDWDGPADCDDGQIETLVDRVRFLISDDARYSYQMDIH